MNPQRARRARWLMVAGVGIAGLIAGIAMLRPRPTTPLPVVATLPEFVLEDEGGDPTGLHDLHGRVWVASLVYTRCADPCAPLTRQVAELAKELGASASLAEVRLVSFSVDPDRDRPEALREYGRVNGADPARWGFLTGPRAVVRGLLRDGFKLPVAEPDDPGAPIVVSSNLLVIDRQGRVRGQYDALTGGGRDSLRDALANLLAEPPPGDVYVPRDMDRPWLAAQATAQAAAVASSAAPHDFRFADRIGASGISFRLGASSDLGRYYRAGHYDHGTAVAAADTDGDELLDLYFVNQVGRSSLFRNRGGGRFEDVTSDAGLVVDGRTCVGAAFADVDNDGDADLFVTCVRDGNILFQNDGRGRFTNITVQAGVAGNGGHSSGAIFFDYDGDGRLDLFVTNVGAYTVDERRPDGLRAMFRDTFAGHLYPQRSERSILYRNRGGARFEDATTASSLVHSAWSGDATAFDYDGDGRQDLYVPSMQGHDEAWHNVGGGRFEKRSRQVFPVTPWGAMGVKVLDWNGDGRFDLLVTDMHTDMSGDELRPEDEKRKHDPRAMFPFRFLGTDGNHVLGNALFTNQGGAVFKEESDAANVETGWPWGPSAGDLNADGWPDLFIAAGMNYPFRYRGNDLLLNDGGRRFIGAEYVLGVEPRRRLVRPWFDLDCDGADVEHDICQGEIQPVLGDETRSPEERSKGALRRGPVTVWASRASRSAAMIDLDNDGDLDIVTNNYGDVPQVLISDLSERGPVHFLEVRLLGTRSNRDGIGAVVRVVAGGRTQVQVNDGKSGYLAQSAMPLYFGLGAAMQADSVSVTWPGGRVQVVRGPLSGDVVVREP